MFPINIGRAESSVFSFVGIGFSPRELLIEGRNATKAFYQKIGDALSENIFQGPILALRVSNMSCFN